MAVRNADGKLWETKARVEVWVYYWSPGKVFKFEKAVCLNSLSLRGQGADTLIKSFSTNMLQLVYHYNRSNDKPLGGEPTSPRNKLYSFLGGVSAIRSSGLTWIFKVSFMN